MKRMQALRLMPSHTFFYKKLDEFGMDHDKEILLKIKNEGIRKTFQNQQPDSSSMSDAQKPNERNGTTLITPEPQQSPRSNSATISSDAVTSNKTKSMTTSSMPDDLTSTENKSVTTSSKPDDLPLTKDQSVVTTSSMTDDLTSTENKSVTLSTKRVNQNPHNLRKQILESLVQIQSKDCQEDLYPQKTNLMVFPNWKVDIDPNSEQNLSVVSQEHINEKVIQPIQHQGNVKVFPCDSSRKFVLDNVDVHQTTHDMNEEHQNPDAHYCSLICTDNRISGNHLSDEKPICHLNNLENGKCCPSKFEHRQQHENYVNLVSIVITNELPCLHFLKDVAIPHIPHMYSKEMREKTNTVSVILYL